MALELFSVDSYSSQSVNKNSIDPNQTLKHRRLFLTGGLPIMTTAWDSPLEVSLLATYKNDALQTDDPTLQSWFDQDMVESALYLSQKFIDIETIFYFRQVHGFDLFSVEPINDVITGVKLTNGWTVPGLKHFFILGRYKSYRSKSWINGYLGGDIPLGEKHQINGC